MALTVEVQDWIKLIEGDEMNKELIEKVGLIINNIFQEELQCTTNGEFVDESKQIIDLCQPQWISIKNRLPETSKAILLFTVAKVPLVGHYHEGIGFYFRGEPRKATHWMPLPNQPEEL